MSNHTDLNLLLDRLDLRYARSLADPYDPETCENALRDNPALVKALRTQGELLERAICVIAQLLPANLGYARKVRDWRTKQSYITAILQASSEPKGEKE